MHICEGSSITAVGKFSLTDVFLLSYITYVEWEVEFTEEFEAWWDKLSVEEQGAIDAKAILLQRVGPSLGRPSADTIRTSRHNNMKELIIQHGGNPYRVFYAFDPCRIAILLIGGIKKDDKKFYGTHVPIADKLYEQHLITIEKEKGDG